MIPPNFLPFTSSHFLRGLMPRRVAPKRFVPSRIAIVACVAGLVSVAIPLPSANLLVRGAHAQEASAGEDSAARQAIMTHPNVVRLRAQICQHFAQADIARAIKEREAESRLAVLQIATIEKERGIIAPLVEKGYEPKIALLSIDSRLQEASGRKELADLAAIRLKSDLATQQKKLLSLENRFQTDSETQLVEMRTIAAQAQARLNALKGKVAYAEVRAPVDGEITAVHFKTIGGVIDAGAVLAEVIPLEEQVTVRARVMPDDVAKIAPGQRVRVSLSSYDVSRYGALDGVVDRIASNSTQEQNVPPYFVAMIKIPDPSFPNSGFQPEITPGMPAIVDVLGDKRTILGYILSPIKRAQTIAFKEK